MVHVHIFIFYIALQNFTRYEFTDMVCKIVELLIFLGSISWLKKNMLDISCLNRCSSCFSCWIRLDQGKRNSHEKQWVFCIGFHKMSCKSLCILQSVVDPEYKARESFYELDASWRQYVRYIMHLPQRTYCTLRIIWRNLSSPIKDIE